MVKSLESDTFFSLNLKLLEVLGVRQVNYWKAEIAVNKALSLILGLAGACAVCCAIPLAAPLIGGLAAGGLIVGFGEGGKLIAGLGAAGLAAFLGWRAWCARRAAHESQAGGGCGCAPANTLQNPETTPIACRLTDRAS